MGLAGLENEWCVRQPDDCTVIGAGLRADCCITSPSTAFQELAETTESRLRSGMPNAIIGNGAFTHEFINPARLGQDRTGVSPERLGRWQAPLMSPANGMRASSRWDPSGRGPWLGAALRV